MSELDNIKNKAKQDLFESVEKAFNLGQSQEVKELKDQLAETLKFAQEAYEFHKVVMNRFCISENNLERDTKNYFYEISNQLKQIKGIKK